MKIALRVSQIAAAFFILVTFSELALAKDSVFVIAGANSGTIDLATLRLLYMGQKRGPQLVDLPSESYAYIEFYRELLGRTPSQVKIIWSELIFSGQCLAPKMMDSDAEVVSYVASHPSSVGYVSDSSEPSIEKAKKDGIRIIIKL